MDVKTTFSLIKSVYNIKFDLKEEQIDIINNIASRKNVFGILPTGFGKSATFVLPPLLLDEVSHSFIHSFIHFVICIRSWRSVINTDKSVD